MERISIQEIAAILSYKNGLKKKDAERFATTMFEVVKDGLEADRLVKIKGLGTFKVIDIEARESVNINTGERVLIEGHGKVTFTPDSTMKELVNKPFSQFETVVLNEGVEFDDDLSNTVETGNTDEEIVETAEAVSETDIQEELIIEQETEEQPVIAEPKEEELPVIVEHKEEEQPAEAESEEEEQPVIAEPKEEELPVIVELEEEEQSAEETAEPAKADNSEGIPVLGLFDSEEKQTEPVITTFEDSVGEEKREEAEEETEVNNENEEATMKRKRGKKTQLTWGLASLLACIGMFALGYFLGLEKGKSYASYPIIEEIIDDSDKQVKETAQSETTAKGNNGVDVPAQKLSPADPVKVVESPVAENSVQTQKQQESPKGKAVAASVESDKYEQKDARVRTGAYRIVGTDYEVQSRAGETTARIARRTLGPDMECYIEAYNDLKGGSALQEGQSVKIPKLELKKKLKKKQN